MLVSDGIVSTVVKWNTLRDAAVTRSSARRLRGKQMAGWLHSGPVASLLSYRRDGRLCVPYNRYWSGGIHSSSSSSSSPASTMRRRHGALRPTPLIKLAGQAADKPTSSSCGVAPDAFVAHLSLVPTSSRSRSASLGRLIMHAKHRARRAVQQANYI